MVPRELSQRLNMCSLMYGLFLLFSSLNYLSQVLAALSQLVRSSFRSKKTCGRILSHFLPSLNRFILKLVFSLIFTLLRETLIGRKPYLGMTQHYPTLLNISKLPHPNCYGRAHRRLMSKTRKYVWPGRTHPLSSLARVTNASLQPKIRVANLNTCLPRGQAPFDRFMKT